MSTYHDVVDAPWNGTPVEGLKAGEQIPTNYQKDSALPQHTLYPITITPVSEVKEYVLTNAGSGVRFSSDGTIRNDDSIDSFYIQMAKSKTGGRMGIRDASKLSDPNRIPLIPDYPSTQLDLDVFDNDIDGLPDAWEIKHGVTESSATKIDWEIQGYKIVNNASYTNLEIDLAELAGDFHILARDL